MAQERIDSIIVQEKIEAEKQYLLQTFEVLEDKIENFGKIVNTANGAKGFKDVATASRELNKVTEETNSLQQRRIKVFEEVLQMQGQLNGSTKETLQNSKLLLQIEQEQIKSSKQKLAAKVDEAKAAAENAKQAKAEAQAAVEEAKAKKAVAATATEIAKAKAIEARALKELALAEKAEAQALKEMYAADKIALANAKSKAAVAEKAERHAKIEEKQAAELANDYLQLSKAYSEAALKAKNYALTLGETHPVTVEAVKDAKAMHDILLRVDQAVGQSQRNVGNYKSAFNGLGVSIAQVSRELPSLAISPQQFFLAISNNLPMVADELSRAKQEIKALKAEGKDAPSIFSKLGSAIFSWQVGLSVGITLLTVYGKEIGEWIGGLFKGKKAVDELKLTQEDLNGTLSDTSSHYAKAIEDVNTLKANIDLAKEGFIDKNDVVKEYNETIGKTTGQVKTLDEAEQALAKNAEAYIKFTLLKAAANFAQQKSAEKLVEAEQIRIKNAKEFSTALDFGVAPSGEFGVDENVIKEQGERVKKLQEKRKLESIRIAKEEADAQEGIARNFQKQAAEIAKDFKFNFFGGGDEDSAAAKKNFDESRKALFELFKIRKEAEAEVQKEESENLANFLKARIEARKKAFDAEKAIVQAQSTLDISEIQKKATEELNQKGITAKQVSDIEKTAALDIQVVRAKSAQDVLKLETALSHDIIKIKQDEKKKEKDLFNADVKLFEDDSAKRLAKELKDAETTLKKKTDFIKEARDIELTALEDNRKLGLITEEQYQQQRLSIETRFANDILRVELDFTEKMIALAKARGEDTTALEAKLANIRLQIKKNEADEVDKTEKETEKKRKKRLDDLNKSIAQVRDISLKAIDALGGILDAGTTARKNQLQEEIDLLSERTQKEIEAVNQSTASEQDKANKIAVINARSNAQKEQFERRQRQLDQQKARFDKAKAIASIIFNTAQGVTAALTSIPPNVPLSIAVGVIGAAELAAAIATPIPKFKTGTKSSPEGWAVTDEAGPEGYIEPGGKTYIGSSKGPTLRYLPKGTEVIPHHELMTRMVNKKFPHFSTPNVSAGRNEVTDMWNEKIYRAIKETQTNVNIQNHIDMDWLIDKYQSIFK